MIPESLFHCIVWLGSTQLDLTWYFFCKSGQGSEETGLIIKGDLKTLQTIGWSENCHYIT